MKLRNDLPALLVLFAVLFATCSTRPMGWQRPKDHTPDFSTLTRSVSEASADCDASARYFDSAAAEAQQRALRARRVVTVEPYVPPGRIKITIPHFGEQQTVIKQQQHE